MSKMKTFYERVMQDRMIGWRFMQLFEVQLEFQFGLSK